MRHLFERSGLRLSGVQLQQFWTFHQLLHQRNVELDLTRLHSFESIVLKHYVDCVLVATLVDLPSPLLDLGTGAGFPGIPLKIVRPDVHVILAEWRAKRVGFLEDAIRALGLRDVEVVAHRIGPRFDRPVRGVITRAVAPIPGTLARVAPWLEPGAQILFMKGPGAQVEVEAAQREFASAFRLARDIPYSIPNTTHTRRLLVFQRLEAPAPARDAAFWEAESADLDDLDLEAEETSVASTRVPATQASRISAPAGTIQDDEFELETEDLAAKLLDFDSGHAEDLDEFELEVHPAEGSPSSVEPGASAGIATGGREVREIHSDSNPTYKLLRAVLTGRGIRKHRRALLAGIRPILEVLRDFPDGAAAWITPGVSPAPPPAAPASLAWYRLTPALFREVDTFGTGPPLLLLEVPAIETWTDADWPPGCTLFLPFQDPENVGAVLRSAAAFGVTRVVLLQEAANPFHPRSARAAGSALLRLRLLRGPSIRDLEAHGAPLLPLSSQGRDLSDFEFPERFGLLPGVEGPGLPERWRTSEALRIPMQRGVESLNAGVATAIALYLWTRQSHAPARGT